MASRRLHMAQLDSVGLSHCDSESAVVCAAPPFTSILMYASTPELHTAPYKIQWPPTILHAPGTALVSLLGTCMGEMARVHQLLLRRGRFEWFDAGSTDVQSVPYTLSLYPAAILFTPPPALFDPGSPTPLSLHLCHVFEGGDSPPIARGSKSPYFQTVTREVGGSSGRTVRMCSLIGLEFTTQGSQGTQTLAGTNTVFKGGPKSHEHNASLVDFVHLDVGKLVLHGLDLALSPKGAEMVNAAIKGSMGVCNGCWSVFRWYRLKSCASCFTGAAYCSVGCQKRHYKTHKVVCLHKRENRAANNGGFFLMLPLEREAGGRQWLLTHDGKIRDCEGRIETAEQAMAALGRVSSSQNQAALSKIVDSWK
jgi:hypothetical protein